MPPANKAGAAPDGLPSPDLLEAYDGIVPGSAKTLIEAFAKQSDHRRAMEQKSLDARIRIARSGQFFGLLIGLAALICGAFSAYHGQQIAASFIGAGGVVGLVSVFVLGRIKLGETTVDK